MRFFRPAIHAPRSRSAFTLLELLAVAVLMGITASVVIPRIGWISHDAKVEVCRQYKADLNASIERYRFQKNALPATLDELGTDEFYGSDLPVCPVDGSRYSLDPQTGRIAGHQH